MGGSRRRLNESQFLYGDAPWKEASRYSRNGFRPPRMKLVLHIARACATKKGCAPEGRSPVIL